VTEILAAILLHTNGTLYVVSIVSELPAVDALRLSLSRITDYAGTRFTIDIAAGLLSVRILGMIAAACSSLEY